MHALEGWPQVQAGSQPARPRPKPSSAGTIKAPVLLVLPHDHAMIHEWGMDEFGFQWKRFYVFAIEQNDCVLTTPKNFQAVVEGDHPDVAGFKPAVVQCARCFLGIIIVTLHDLGSASVNFAAASATMIFARTVRVENSAAFQIDDADFCLRVGRPHSTNDEILPGPHGQDRRRFGKPIASRTGMPMKLKNSSTCG